MAYTESCKGNYIGECVMQNPDEFNRLLNEGYSLLDARKATQKGGVIFQTDFYPLFKYEVNGVEYVRASRKLHEHFGRSIGKENMWMRGSSCNVLYDPENPGDAVIEDKKGETQSGSFKSQGSSKTSWIVIAIFAVISLLFFFGKRCF